MTATAQAPTAADAKAFVEKAEEKLLAASIAAERANWVAANFITEDTELIAAEAKPAPDGAGRRPRQGGDPLRRSRPRRRRRPQARAPQALAHARRPRRPEEERGARPHRRRHGGGLRAGQVDAARRRAARPRGDLAPDGDEPRPEGARRALGRLALHRPAAAQGVHPLRRARQRRSEGARLRRHGRHVAVEVRHAAGRLREGARPALGAGEAPLHLASRVRPDEARARPTARTSSPRRGRSRRTSSGTCGPSSGATSTRSSPRRTPTRATTSRRSSSRRRPTRSRWSATARASSPRSGCEPLPKTFWERSLFTRPRDREVVCHASAWCIDWVDDLRLKMCIEINAEDFATVHHELGHNVYQRAYNRQPVLFRDSANDGFHEAIGDTVALSLTPEYLVKLGLLPKAPPRGQGRRLPPQHGARQDRLPAVRSPHRQVALAGLLGRSSRGPLEPGVVGPEAEVPGRRPAGGAHRGRLRPGRQVPHRLGHSLLALLPRRRPAVPDAPRPREDGRLHRRRSTPARSTGTRRPGRG